MPATAQRPNILLLCSDQQHWRKCGFNGHPLVRTPNLDRLAAEGTNFQCCYSNSPVCAPSRAAMFTGRYASDVGSYCNSLPFDGRVPTFANVARDQGYTCVASGKLDFFEDTDYGFEENVTSHGHDGNPDITSLFRNPLCYRQNYGKGRTGTVRDGETRDWQTVGRTCEFLTERSAQIEGPWLAYSGWNMPHPPFKAREDLFESYHPLSQIDLPHIPEDWAERDHPVMFMTRWHRCSTALAPEEDVRKARAAYYAMITEVDEMVGKVLDTLEATGQRENTIIIFTSDHGEMLGENGHFRKNLPYDACARVPLLMAGPGIEKGKAVTHPVSLMDIYATIVDIAGGPRLDGVRAHSLLPVMNDDTSNHPHVLVELNTERLLTGIFTLRCGEWKYSYFSDYPDQLFNLEADPGEWNDLAGDPAHEDVRRTMRDRLFAIYDPDDISDQAFAAQRRKLDEIMAGRDEAYMVERLRSRLGEAQARHFARRYFMHKKAGN